MTLPVEIAVNKDNATTINKARTILFKDSISFSRKCPLFDVTYRDGEPVMHLIWICRNLIVAIFYLLLYLIHIQ